MSRRERTILTIITVLLVLFSLVAASWLVYLVATAIVTATAKIAGAIAAAVIGLVGTLMAAILNHANQLDAQRKHEEYRAKQDNYKELLSKVGAFARADSSVTKAAGDDLSSAHLASWAFGDREVLESTNRFQRYPKRETLLGLLEAVRDSLDYKGDLPEDFTRNTDRYNPSVLFAPAGTTETGPFEELEALEAERDQLEAAKDQTQARIDQLEARKPEAGQNEEVENKGNSDESETTNRGHTMNLSDTEPRPRPQVDASENTKMPEPPVNDAKPDTGKEEKDERTAHRWREKLANWWRRR
jgi:hypothetical protein